MLREVAGGTGIGVYFNIGQRAGRAAPAKPLATARSAHLVVRSHFQDQMGIAVVLGGASEMCR